MLCSARTRARGAPRFRTMAGLVSALARLGGQALANAALAVRTTVSVSGYDLAGALAAPTLGIVYPHDCPPFGIPNRSEGRRRGRYRDPSRFGDETTQKSLMSAFLAFDLRYCGRRYGAKPGCPLAHRKAKLESIEAVGTVVSNDTLVPGGSRSESRIRDNRVKEV